MIERRAGALPAAARDAEARWLPVARDRKVGVRGNGPFDRGELLALVRNKPLPALAREVAGGSGGQFFLTVSFGHPTVTRPILAASEVKLFRVNMLAGTGLLPDEAARRKMIPALAL